MEHVSTLESAAAIVKDSRLVFMSLSKQDCRICKILKPKMEKALSIFPNLKALFVDIEDLPEAKLQYKVQKTPTILLFAMGKEVVRVDRSHDPEELTENVAKYYKILFN